MEEITTIKMNGRTHVVTSVERNGRYKIYDPHTGNYLGEGEPIPQPNYKGTGKALCGILRKSEVLETWKSRKLKRAEIWDMVAKREETDG